MLIHHLFHYYLNYIFLHKRKEGKPMNESGTEELKRLKREVTGGFESRAAACDKLDIRLPIVPPDNTVMLILVDKYGNEKKITLEEVR